MSADVTKLKAEFTELEANMTKAKTRIAELESEKAAGFGGGQDTKGSDEARLLRSFRCSNVKQLMEVNTAHPTFAGVSISDRLAVIELKKEIDVARYYAQIFCGAPRDVGEMEKQGQIAQVKGLLDTRYAKESDLQGRLKAFGTGVVGAGAEWIETMISSSYVEEYLLEKRVANAFQEIPMASNPFKLPVAKNGTTARIVAEGVAASESNFGTDAITFDAENKLVELYNLPEELNEDSAVAILSMARAGVLDSQIKALETAILNGDTTGTHMDSDVVSAADARKCWKGLRKLALQNTANGSIVDFGSATTATKLDEMIAAAGKFSLNPREVMFMVSPQISHQMSALPEVTSVDKFGPLATILSGLLAAYRGRGIMASEFLREDLNAAGVYDGVTMTKGGLLLVNKTRFFLGRRRPIRVRVAADSRAEYDRYQLVSYQRADFEGHVQSATEKGVIYGVNVTL